MKTKTMIISATQSAYIERGDGDEYALLDVCLEGQGSGTIEFTCLGDVYQTPFVLDGGLKTVSCRFKEPEAETSLIGNVISEYEKNSFELTVKPVRRYEVCFVPVTHHDFGYTAVIADLLESFIGYYDDVLDFCDMTDAYPPEAKYRYTVEQSYTALYYLQHCSQRNKERFIQRAREGRIEILGTFANIAESVCSDEELIRMLYPSFSLKSKYGIPIDTAALVDMPGMGWGVPKVLKNAGINYFFAGFPTYFEWYQDEVKPGHLFWDEDKVLRNGRPDAFYYQAQDGSKILVYYQGSYGWFCGSTHGDVHSPNFIEDVQDNLSDMLKKLSDQNTPFDVLRYIDHGLDNYPPQITISDIVRRWNEKYAAPKLCVATQRVFFEKLEEQCHDLRCFSGELPHTDYPTLSMSCAKETALNTTTKALLPCAESLTLLSDLLAGTQMCQQFKSPYQDLMLFDEHCYGMARPFGKIFDYNWNLKSSYAYRAAATTEKMISRSFSAISTKVKSEKGRLIINVFNNLSFERTDVVRVSNFLFDILDYELVDMESGETIPYQYHFISDSKIPFPYAAHRNSMYRMDKKEQFMHFATEILFEAKDLPPCGYKSYYLKEGKARKEYENQSGAGHLMENRYYRIIFDETSGFPCSIFDKELERELLDKDCAYPFGSVLSIDAQTRRVFAEQSTRLFYRAAGDVFQSMTAIGACEGCPEIVREYTLYNETKRIDFSVRILKNSTAVRHVYAAFPFGVKKPTFAYDGAHCKPIAFSDILPGAQSNQLCVQNYVEVADEQMKILVCPTDSLIVELGGLWPSAVSQAHHGVHPVDFEKPFVCKKDIEKGHVYSLLAYNNCRTNFSLSQNGELLFSYSITSVKPEESSERFGLSAKQKPIPCCLTADGNGSLPPSYSFASLNSEHVEISAVKRAEDGEGIIVRMLETAGAAADFLLKLDLQDIRRVHKTSITEENLNLLQFDEQGIRLHIEPYGIVTLRVRCGKIDESRRNFDNEPPVEFMY